MINLIGTIKDKDFLELNLDTFIIGNERFAVRIPASFEYEEIEKITSFLHSKNKNVWVSVNKLFTEDEIDGLEEYLLSLVNLKVNGIVFSDMAVFQIAKRNNFINLLVYDPDTLMVNQYDVSVFKQLGIQEVILSKDITLDNIKDICDYNPNFCSILAYGHFPLFYSKRKLVENYFKAYKKDAKKYIENRFLKVKEATRNGLYPIYQDNNGTIIYSDQKICYLNYIKEIKNSKVHGLYLFFYDEDFNEATSIVNLYKDALNGLEITIEDKDYTTGYLFRKTGVK